LLTVHVWIEGEKKTNAANAGRITAENAGRNGDYNFKLRNDVVHRDSIYARHGIRQEMKRGKEGGAYYFG